MLFLTVVLVLQYASPARSEESEAERLVHREGRALFDEGHDAYKANDFKTALRKFQQSRIRYASLRLPDDIDKCDRAIHAAACMDRIDEKNLNQLKELVGEPTDKPPRSNDPYVGACLPFPDLSKRVKANIAVLEGQR
ncbi:hypothetical protein CO669_06790 [Bradyrhizobium sp. Y36]|nr:hypothetical protein CO669_06790 [Bradyrhizobium sp. Y36]